MMKQIRVTINGKAYPCAPTMGAMLRFYQETGREITAINPGSFSDMCVYLWCCVVSACRRDGVDFDMSLMDFADSLSPTDMQAWVTTVTTAAPAEESGSKAEKKRR